MVRKEPVSVNWQTLFAIIPFVDLWASYRIQKLRLYLLISIAIITTEILIEISIFGVDAWLEEPNEFSAQSTLQTAFLLSELGISMFLMRRWSREWNEKISSIN